MPPIDSIKIYEDKIYEDKIYEDKIYEDNDETVQTVNNCFSGKLKMAHRISDAVDEEVVRAEYVGPKEQRTEVLAKTLDAKFLDLGARFLVGIRYCSQLDLDIWFVEKVGCSVFYVAMTIIVPRYSSKPNMLYARRYSINGDSLSGDIRKRSYRNWGV